MNRLIFYVLRGGVAVSVVIILVGLALLATGRPTPPGGLQPAQIPAELLAGTPAGFLGLGILLLVLTPVARVFLSIAYFAREGDRDFVVITVVVFLILMVGIAVGRR